MKPEQKARIIEKAESYALFYRLYMEELEKGNPQYKVWDNLKNEKLQQFDDYLDTL